MQIWCEGWQIYKWHTFCDVADDGGDDDDDDGDDDDKDKKDDDAADEDDDDGSSAVGTGLQDNAAFAISFRFYCFKTPLSQFSKYQFLCQEVLV